MTEKRKAWAVETQEWVEIEIRSPHPEHPVKVGTCTCHYNRCLWECECGLCICCGGRSWDGAVLADPEYWKGVLP